MAAIRGAVGAPCVGAAQGARRPRVQALTPASVPAFRCARSSRARPQLVLTTAATAGASSSGAAAGAALPAAASYQWSWEDAGGASEGPSPFDAQHPLPEGPLSAEAFAALLDAAAAADAQPSRGWLAAACAAAAPALGSLPPDQSIGLLQQLSAVGYCPPGEWRAQLLGPLAAAAGGGGLGTRQLADALWALSNLSGLLTGGSASSAGSGGGGAAAVEAVRALLGALARQLQDFYGPDLARAVCAAGTLATSGTSFDADVASGGGSPGLLSGVVRGSGSGGGEVGGSGSRGGGGSGAVTAQQLGVDAGWMTKVLEECEYQVVEFTADYGAFDLARLALGLALLSEAGSSGTSSGGGEAGGGGGSSSGGAAWPEAGGRLREALLKAVYARTRTIEEKAAVDYALARLDAKGKRSMHYDPRWTHEELKWLPRRERDKQRILKDGWYRKQWQGFRSGQ